MKRVLPYIACVVGVVVLALLMGHFNAAQPAGIRLTRNEAKTIADVAAQSYGIPVANSWPTTTWTGSPLLDKQLQITPSRLKLAQRDAVIGPRLGAYHITYFRNGREKNVPYGFVEVSGQTGKVIAVRVRHLSEDRGAQMTEAALRGRADAFVHSRTFPGAPSPQFESARPAVQRSRTDWIFRYRIPSTFRIGNVVPYLYVHFSGDQQSGFELIEEYTDGSQFHEDSSSNLIGAFAEFVLIFALLLLFLIMFLRKYHAGEVGVGTALFLFCSFIVVAVILDVVIGPSLSVNDNFGSLDAARTVYAWVGFKFLFYDLPTALLIFLSWAVGESYARERWGDRLASFDAILRRDPLNATVGRSVLHGLLISPAIAAAAFAIGAIPLFAGLANPSFGRGSSILLDLGGPVAVLLQALSSAILHPVVAILGVLALAKSKRFLPLGVVVALVLGVAAGVCELPLEPFAVRALFGFGGIGAVVVTFLAWDLLTATVSLFGGTALAIVLPLLSVAKGDLYTTTVVTLAIPALLTAVFAVVALMTRREVEYTHDDLAPHVKRIVERERVKAEIDAANRIQAALLPSESPVIPGIGVASHYRAASEIGGDYFDFLAQPTGEMGIAFGDVSGHGLTSGIVMAMAKAALLVQVDYDASPRAVMNVLNDIVIRVAPKRILMTFFFGLLDARSQTLRFSSAGHHDPYVYRASSGKLEPLSSWGFPLGVKRRDPFREHSVEFAPGDRLVLYSDGLIEALDDDGEPYGFERFEKTLMEHGHGTADEIKKDLLLSLRKFTKNRPPEDDQTLVVISFDEVVVGDTLPAPAVSAYSDHVN